MSIKVNVFSDPSRYKIHLKKYNNAGKRRGLYCGIKNDADQETTDDINEVTCVRCLNAKNK